ncbi:MAG: GIY-YIG nuclease family protein [Patescibacteria group bacterium]
MFYVYVLRSLKNQRLYVGCTNNLERRIEEHNRGQSTYTKLTRPFVLLYHEILPDLKSARGRERMLKGGQGREWLSRKLNLVE